MQKVDNLYFQLTENNTLKLADIGVTSSEFSADPNFEPADPITWYSAPEIMEGSVCDSASDVYAMAIIIWELWYGVLADKYFKGNADGDETNIDEEIDKTYKKGARSGLRPYWLESRRKPSLPFQRVLNNAWSHTRTQRPSADECKNFFCDVKHGKIGQ